MSTSNDARRDRSAGARTETEAPRPRPAQRAHLPRDSSRTASRLPSTRSSGSSAPRRSRTRRAKCSSSRRTSRSRRRGRMTATNIVAQKYFHGKPGTPQRERSVKQLIGRVVDTITAFGQKSGYFRTAADRDAFSDELAPHPREPGRELQLARLVQRRRRAEAAGVRVLHQLRRRLDVLDPRPREDGRHALQVRLGHGLEPLLAPLVDRVALLGRHRVRPRLLHEGLRQLRGRDQVRRQDAPRREDGHPERGPSGHRGIHRSARRRKRRRPGTSSTPAGTARSTARSTQHRLPEREPLRARHGRVHAAPSRPAARTRRRP